MCLDAQTLLDCHELAVDLPNVSGSLSCYGSFGGLQSFVCLSSFGSIGSLVRQSSCLHASRVVGALAGDSQYFGC